MRAISPSSWFDDGFRSNDSQDDNIFSLVCSSLFFSSFLLSPQSSWPVFCDLISQLNFRLCSAKITARSVKQCLQNLSVVKKGNSVTVIISPTKLVRRTYVLSYSYKNYFLQQANMILSDLAKQIFFVSLKSNPKSFKAKVKLGKKLE